MGFRFLQHYKIIGGGHYWFDLSVNDENLDQLIWRFLKNMVVIKFFNKNKDRSNMSELLSDKDIKSELGN